MSDKVKYFLGYEETDINNYTRVFEGVGCLWNNYNYEVISDGSEFYVLYGWNGEKYYKCWKVLDNMGIEKSNDTRNFVITPIQKEVDKDEDEYEIVNYDINLH